MSWAVGYDWTWQRDIGYGVPAFCDHPGCTAKIDRGLAFVCCGQEPYGGDGCGLYFCDQHADWMGRCERCAHPVEGDVTPFEAKPDHPEWIQHKLTDESWQEWRDENPEAVDVLRLAFDPGASRSA